MCYSAQALQDYRKYVRVHGATLGLEEFIRLFWDWHNGAPHKLPKAMLDAFADPATCPDPRIRQWIDEWKTQQATALEQELFAQKTRLVGAQRALQSKLTRKAQDDVRIATGKIERAGQRLKDLRRSEPLPRDSRIFPGQVSCVMVAEAGNRLLFHLHRLVVTPGTSPRRCSRWRPAAGRRRAVQGTSSGRWRGPQRSEDTGERCDP